MARLSYMRDLMSLYLTLHGDKEVTSISSCHGGDEEYAINLYDIYDGPAGTNPYCGSDRIPVLRNGSIETTGTPHAEGRTDIEAYLEMQKEITASDRSVEAKMLMAYGALTLLKHEGRLDDKTVNDMFQEFIFKELGLRNGPV